MVHALVADSWVLYRPRGSCAECVCATVSRAGAAHRPRGLAAPSQLLRPGESVAGRSHSRSWSRRLFCRLEPGSTARRAFARVCSYDRAGAGWSDLGPRPRTMRQQVWELHALLEKAGEKPPFVLVGHSYGGWLARLFAETYPADVSGLVLVESGAEDPLRVIDGKVTHASELAKGQTVPPVKTSDPLHESDIPPRIVGLIQSSIRGMGGHFNDPPRDKLPPEARRMREWSLSQIKHAASNDNPFSESQFRTLKYRPEFPDRFGSIQDSRAFCHTFFPWHNDHHRHSGIGMMTPAMVHYGLAPAVRQNRQLVLDAAYAAHPDRFVRKPPVALPLPKEVWINKPQNSDDNTH